MSRLSAGAEHFGADALAVVADAHLAGHLARQGDLERAYRVQRALETDVIWGSEAAVQIARAHASRGEFTQALEAAAKIRTRELRVPALAEIAVAHTISGAPLDDAVTSRLEHALLGADGAQPQN